MGDKFKEEELLGRLERIVKPAMCHLRYWTKKDEQAVQQIKERIQSYEEYQELTINYIGIVLDLYDQLEKKKPEIRIRPRFSKRTEVMEEWIKDKVTTLFVILNNLKPDSHDVYNAETFIRSLVESVPAKKATVGEEFVERWSTYCGRPSLTIKQLLKEAGVEIVGK